MTSVLGVSIDPDAGLVIRSWWAVLLATGLSLLMLVLVFPPIDVWPLAYVCLAPWVVVIGATESPRRVYLASYLFGVAFFSISMHWLFLVTIAGAVVLFVALALYFPLMACPVRHLIRRRRLPMALGFPIIWVAAEAVRSIIIPRFPWSLLGHSQHGVLTMIQVSDLVGAYGVSFVAAAVNGLLADMLLSRAGWPVGEITALRRRPVRFSLAFTGVLVAGTIIYGQVQLRRGTMSDGPKIAILQGNYPNYVDPEIASRQPTPKQRALRYFELLSLAAGEDKPDASPEETPDLFLLPETPWMMHLNKEFLSRPLERWWVDTFRPQECYDAFQEFAREHDAYLVTGAMSVEPTPLDLKASERRYNSAFVFSPEGGEPARYDKTHLVLIGEYVPFRYGPLRFFYLWVNRMVPFGAEGDEYSLMEGTELRTFEMEARTRGGRKYTFATPICYENVMPYISRTFANGPDGRKRCDFLLNLSNDGWFLHSWELPQHLAASVFRAVENRLGVARAVNTGISCFVDPDGRVHHVVSEDGVVVGPGVDGYRVANVRVDSRHSIYSRYGDFFAIACILLWGVVYLDYVVVRSLSERRQKGAPA